MFLGLVCALALGCSGGSDEDGSGGSGGAVDGCQMLCAHTDTATSSEAECVGSQAGLKGYGWPSDPVCSTIATESMCNTCTQNLAMTDADCAAVESACF
jgi:hypothetical protein